MAVNYFRPIPAVHATTQLPSLRTVPGPAPTFPWPSVGGAAVAVSGLGIIGSANAGTTYPIASVAKLMTAVVVLDGHPLAPGQQGPVLTISARDRQDFLAKSAQGESVLDVRPGELEAGEKVAILG